MALVSESALELASSLDLQDDAGRHGQAAVRERGVHECEITVIEGDELHTLMRVAGGEVDEEWMGSNCCSPTPP